MMETVFYWWYWEEVELGILWKMLQHMMLRGLRENRIEAKIGNRISVLENKNRRLRNRTACPFPTSYLLP